jgi:hypothetical protein
VNDTAVLLVAAFSWLALGILFAFKRDATASIGCVVMSELMFARLERGKGKR